MKNPIKSKFCGNCGEFFEDKFLKRSITSGLNSIPLDLNYEKENMKIQRENLKLQQQQLLEQKKQYDSMAKCPRCGSTPLSGYKKGFGTGKAIIGICTFSPLGLVMGNIGAIKVVIMELI